MIKHSEEFRQEAVRIWPRPLRRFAPARLSSGRCGFLRQLYLRSCRGATDAAKSVVHQCTRARHGATDDLRPLDATERNARTGIAFRVSQYIPICAARLCAART